MDVEVELSHNGFKVSYSLVNKYTNKRNTNSFHIDLSRRSEDKVPTLNQMRNLTKSALDNLDPEKLFGKGKAGRSVGKMSIREVKQYLMNYIRSSYRTEWGKRLLDELDTEQPKELQTSGSVHAINNKIEAHNFPDNKSIFTPEESAKTYCLLGASFSGKTTLLVNELNKLSKYDYNKIFIFTESLNAAPLKKLRKDLEISIYDTFNPQIPKILKQINTITKNRFKFLVVLDDIVSNLRGETLTKMILTMRNSNISSCILIQYAKLISPPMRNSMHEYYILRLRTEDWMYMLKGFLAQHFRDVLNVKQGSYQKLAELVKDTVSPHSNINNWKNSYIVKYDQRMDKLEFFNFN